MAKVTAAPVGYYTTDQAVRRTRLNQILFRWIVHTEPIEVTFLEGGKRPLYTERSIQQITDFVRSKDPAGRYFLKESRRNGPRRKRGGRPGRNSVTGAKVRAEPAGDDPAVH